MQKFIHSPKIFITFMLVILVAFMFIVFPASWVAGKQSNVPLSGQAAILSETEIPTQSEGCSSCEVVEMKTIYATLTAIAQNLTTTPQPAKPQTSIYFFWGDGCPHCAAAKPFLQSLVDKNPQLKLIAYEVYFVPENFEIFLKVAAAYGFEPHAVPTIFIGDQYWEGYADSFKPQIEAAAQKCITKGCPDRAAEVLQIDKTPITPTALPTGVTQKTISDQPTIAATKTPSILPTASTPEQTPAKETIQIPLIGAVDLSKQSLFISTLLISFVDGFNPCSIWVLGMLLSITLHTGSRKKILIIGLVFLTVTALIYALFIAGLFTIFKFIRFIGWIRVLVALVALFFASVNIKDYFWYKKGISFTIDDQKKPGIYRQIRRVMDAGDSFGGLVGGTIILAAGVSLVEFSCTAGFPVLWTNLLSAQEVTAATFILLLVVYLVIYQLDELGIFLASVFTLRSSKLEEKHGRILKLVGGMLMLTLAGVMLVKPSLMNDLTHSMLVFGIAFAATAIILLFHRVILPRFGIHIGSEFSETNRSSKSETIK